MVSLVGLYKMKDFFRLLSTHRPGGRVRFVVADPADHDLG